MQKTATYDIFMDGTCSFCQWTRELVEPYDSGKQLRFLDYNDSTVAAQAPFPRGELDREMHVRTPEGSWLKGFEAWLALASHPLAGPIPVRIYRSPPLQPPWSARALLERHLRDSRAPAEVTHARVPRDTIFAP